MPPFTGWPEDATAFLAEIAADNSREFWMRNRERHDAHVLAPTRDLSGELEWEFGPVRVFRPYRNRRYRFDLPPYRTDTGVVATPAGGASYSVVLSATGLTTTCGQWLFDREQLQRYRRAVLGSAGSDLERLLEGCTVAEDRRMLARVPRGLPGDHPRAGLLRRRGLQVTQTWEAGEWLSCREPLYRVREAWRAATPIVTWLDEHAGLPAAAALPA